MSKQLSLSALAAVASMAFFAMAAVLGQFDSGQATQPAGMPLFELVVTR